MLDEGNDGRNGKRGEQKVKRQEKYIHGDGLQGTRGALVQHTSYTEAIVEVMT